VGLNYRPEEEIGEEGNSGRGGGSATIIDIGWD